MKRLLMVSLLAFIMTIVLSSSVMGNSFHLYERSESLSNMKYDTYLSEVMVRSVIECGRQCHSNTGCAAFNFEDSNDIGNNCQLFDISIPSTGTPTQGMNYYALKTQPVTANPPECLTFETDTPETLVLLSDNTLFTYSIHQGTANYDDATTDCVSRGGYLARVVTLAKQDALRMLVSCTGFSSADYWLDGSNLLTGTNNEWHTTDLQVIPMTQGDFWGAGKPNYPDSQHCMRMRSAVAHLWDDTDCSYSYGYICEY